MSPFDLNISTGSQSADNAIAGALSGLFSKALAKVLPNQQNITTQSATAQASLANPSLGGQGAQSAVPPTGSRSDLLKKWFKKPIVWIGVAVVVVVAVLVGRRRRK